MKNVLDSCITALLLLALAFSSMAHGASKSDLAKEKRWEEQIVPSLLVGEDIKLKADDLEFLALYAEPSTEQSKGAVILLHGIGVHPAWPDVIEPLRMELPDYGWHTLSLQMPILRNEAEGTDYPPLFPEVPARIQAGIDYLKAKGVDNIVLAGHSLGATMASYYLATNQDSTVKGLAILSGGFGVPGDALMDSLEHIKKIEGVDILDVYGSDDRQPVLEVIEQRKVLGKEVHGDRYQVVKIDGAGHFYRGRQNELTDKLNRWLNEIVSP